MRSTPLKVGHLAGTHGVLARYTDHILLFATPSQVVKGILVLVVFELPLYAPYGVRTEYSKDEAQAMPVSLIGQPPPPPILLYQSKYFVHPLPSVQSLPYLTRKANFSSQLRVCYHSFTCTYPYPFSTVSTYIYINHRKQRRTQKSGMREEEYIL